MNQALRAHPPKSWWRTAFEAIRFSLPDSYRADASTRIVRAVLDLTAESQADSVHVYWPMDREVDTRPLIHALVANGVSVYLPVVLQYARQMTDTPRIGEARFESEERSLRNRWGALEPAGAVVRPLASSLVVLPGLGAGLNGTRIGHGWGYYDELLLGSTAPTVLPCYQACVTDFIEPEGNDIPIATIVTEAGTVTANPASRL